MRSIDLSLYPVTFRTPQGEQTQDYDVKASLRGVLLSQQLQLDAASLLRNYEIAQKVGQADGQLLIEEADYQVLSEALGRLRGFTENDVPFIRRIKDAPQVPVELKVVK